MVPRPPGRLFLNSEAVRDSSDPAIHIMHLPEPLLRCVALRKNQRVSSSTGLGLCRKYPLAPPSRSRALTHPRPSSRSRTRAPWRRSAPPPRPSPRRRPSGRPRARSRPSSACACACAPPSAPAPTRRRRRGGRDGASRRPRRRPRSARGWRR